VGGGWRVVNQKGVTIRERLKKTRRERVELTGVCDPNALKPLKVCEGGGEQRSVRTPRYEAAGEARKASAHLRKETTRQGCRQFERRDSLKGLGGGEEGR